MTTDTRAPVTSAGRFEFDDARWQALMSDMPSGYPKNASSAHQAMLIPGCCIKSAECRPGDLNRRRFTARVLRVDAGADEVTVLSHVQTFGEGLYVWTGTVAEYFSAWECD